MTRRVLVLVDGEHHPDAVRAALDGLRQNGDDPALALYVGGSEKIAERGVAPDLGVPSAWPEDPLSGLANALQHEDRVDGVVDLTADPAVDDRQRARLVAVALDAGVAYAAAGVRWMPPPRPVLSHRPCVAVVATGKRAGKTAMSAALARTAATTGHHPVVVAMGRGGPADPVVVPAGQRLSVEHLLEIARDGGHAASDFYEDALMTGLATVGCRRVGEGPSGEVAASNVAAGMAAAERVEADLVVLEGSGAAVPPAHADATALVVPALADPVSLHAMLPLRFLVADVIVVTLADRRVLAAGQLRAVLTALEQILGALPATPSGKRPRHGVVVTRFRPHPLQPVAGRRVFVATTAPRSASRALNEDITALGAVVVGITHDLADRVALRRALADAPAHDILLTELKAAAVDVAAALATDRGAVTVFYDNRPEVVDAQPAGTGPATVEAALAPLVATAAARAAQRRSARSTTRGV